MSVRPRSCESALFGGHTGGTPDSRYWARRAARGIPADRKLGAFRNCQAREVFGWAYISLRCRDIAGDNGPICGPQRRANRPNSQASQRDFAALGCRRVASSNRGVSRPALTCLALKLTPHVFMRLGELRHAEWLEFESTGFRALASPLLNEPGIGHPMP